MDRFEAVEAMGNSSVEANLHSSMDRFEVLTVMIVNLQGFIYIPVWIDLKLKLIHFHDFLLLYLHSSMDRFEVNKPFFLL